MKTTLIWIAIISGFLWYIAIGNLARPYIGGEKGKLWDACRAEQEFQMLSDEPARTCDRLQFNYDPPGVTMGAAIWPVVVPIVYVVRNPRAIAIIVPSLALVLVGGLMVWRGTGQYLKRRRFAIAQTQRETAEKLSDADAYLKREAPEFSKSLVSS
jgi:hypothetical protein